MTRGGHRSRFESAKFSGRASLEDVYLRELVEVLLLHPMGLRRWSVMRAIRSRCQSRGADVSLKMEDEVERLFRNSCSQVSAANDLGKNCTPENALFYRPQDRAGEVWAVNAVRASAWLAIQKMAHAS